MSNMKTVRQHFEEYPDRKIRDAMLRNMLEHPRGDPPNAIAAGLADALWRGFDWCRTPEGYDHWDTLYNHIAPHQPPCEETA